MYKFKSSKRHLLIAAAIGVAIGLVIGFYSIQPKPEIKTPQKQISEPLGYFSPDGKFHSY